MHPVSKCCTCPKTAFQSAAKVLRSYRIRNDRSTSANKVLRKVLRPNPLLAKGKSRSAALQHFFSNYFCK